MGGSGGEDGTDEGRVLGHLILILLEHPHVDHIDRLDMLESVPEGTVHIPRSSAVPAGRHDLETDAGPVHLPHDVGHSHGIVLGEMIPGVGILIRGRCRLVLPREIVEAAHVEIGIPPPFLDILHYFGNVRAYPGRQSLIANHPDDIPDRIYLPHVPAVVGVRSMVVDGDRFVPGNFGDVAAYIGEFRGRLGHPLNLPSLQLVFQEHPHLMSIAPRLEGIDAMPHAFVEQSLEIRHGVVFDHLPVQVTRHVGEAAQRVSAADEPGHFLPEKINRWQQGHFLLLWVGIESRHSSREDVGSVIFSSLKITGR